MARRRSDRLVHIAEIAIRRWQLTLVLFFMLAALGYSALRDTPRAVDPHFSMPVVVILALQPGADAEEIEETITRPIEDIVQGLEDVKEIVSTSNDSSTVVRAEFDWSGDPDIYFNDAVREVQAARGQLPADMPPLRFEKMRTNNAAVLQLALVSETASWHRMDKYARDISDAFARFADVRQANVTGLLQPEVTVALDSGRLAQLRLPAYAVADAIRQGGLDIAAGSVRSGTRRLNVDAGGAYRDLEEIRALPVRSNQGSNLTVGDVAKVEWGAAEERVKRSHNGQRAVFINVDQKRGSDATKLRNALMVELEKQKALLPADIKSVVQFDQTVMISKRLSELTRDFLIALTLVLITLLPLGLRASAIVMISIPLSLACGLIAVQLSGFNLSQLVIAGFILSLGLLVDDSIVVVENIARHLRMGKTREQAAVDATREITKAVIGSTGVIIGAFVPVLFLPDGAGKYITSFMATTIYTIAASMVVSLTIVPFLASRILRRDSDPDGNGVLRWLTRNIERIYHPLLRRALNAPRTTVWGALILTSLAFLLIPVIGLSLFPDADSQHFRVSVEAERGSSLAETERLVRKVSDIMKEEPAIKVRAESVGAQNPSVFYNHFEIGQDIDRGEILAVMDDWEGQESYSMIARLRSKLDDIPGARVKIVLFQNGAPLVAPVEFRVKGNDLDELKRIANQVETVLQETPGTRDVINPVAAEGIDLDMQVDAARAALLNVENAAPRRAIRLALSGEQSGNFRDSEGDSYPVMVRLPRGSSHPISALEDIFVPGRAGDNIRLAEITTPRLVAAPPPIWRYNLERYVSVTAQLEPGGVISKVNDVARSKLRDIELPPGYAIEVGGEAEKITSTFAGFGPVILAALFSIFAILIWEFGRFREALVVAGVIPLGTFGGLMALFLSGNSLSFLAGVGFIALVGIEIKNSILLVDFTSQLREQGMKLRQAIEHAGKVRFLPVLLTSVTAVGGLMPLALFGGSLYSPLALVLIGGLISSTLLSRIVTPAMYLLVVRGAEDDGREQPDQPAEPVNA